MILTVTLNPSIDVSYPLDQLNLDTVNRVDKVSKTPGGKGLNVTRVLKTLDADVKATGVLGGHFGEYIESKLDEVEINHQFSKIDGETRFCIAILHEGNQTEVLEKGPEIDEEDIYHFKDAFRDLVSHATTITMSGSMLKGFPSDTYSELIAIANDYGRKVLLDTSGDSLLQSLKGDHKPYLIKPNTEELEGLVNENIDPKNTDQLKEVLSNSLFDGVEMIVVTLGGDGALVKYQDKFYQVIVPKINPVNPVGSGDSTIAGLAYAIDEGKDFSEIIKTGMTCGVLNTLNEKTGAIDMNQFDTFFDQINVSEI
ncbi:hexose kinase [Aerococcus suis]|uniref:Tagatose-6-phosphate kinase n=1 Tax=Aerococcus suis TaxID=371602 RepID=A0A1W1ZCS4_9LACT|nr:hexose kinase [Aerococcus suis]MDD7758205.1 hexose kinase [Aerococcus suis]MDY4646803.1 hexose kinase [Aerococcus suis]SMC46072.1 tagatose 6-phosphate kinase [Aerococcus suis]